MGIRLGGAKTLAHGGYEGEPVLTFTDSTVFRQGPKFKGLQKIFLRHGKFGYISGSKKWVCVF